jgi:hypothetical protein
MVPVLHFRYHVAGLLNTLREVSLSDGNKMILDDARDNFVHDVLAFFEHGVLEKTSYPTFLLDPRLFLGRAKLVFVENQFCRRQLGAGQDGDRMEKGATGTFTSTGRGDTFTLMTWCQKSGPQTRRCPWSFSLKRR